MLKPGVKQPIMKSKETESPKDFTKRHIEVFSSEFDVPQDVTPLPLKTTEQQVVVFNLCHKDQNVRCETPGIRLLGIFPSRSEAGDFCNTNHSNLAASIFLSDTHVLFPLCSSFRNSIDNEYPKKVIEANLEVHEKLLASRQHEFRSNIQKQEIPSVPNKEPDGTSHSDHLQRIRQAKFEETVKGMKKDTSVLTNGTAVSNQECAVIIIMKDLRRSVLLGHQDPEPLVAVLFAGSEKDCLTYAKYTASQAYKDNVIDVVNMYQWLHPMLIEDDKLTSEMYGSPFLQEIMDGRKRNIHKLDEFEKMFQEDPSIEQNMVINIPPPNVQTQQ